MLYSSAAQKKASEIEVDLKVLGAVICESKPIGMLSFEGEIVCKEGTKHGEQQFTSGTDPSGKVVKGSLTAETIFGIFKTTEKDAQIATENLNTPRQSNKPWEVSEQTA